MTYLNDALGAFHPQVDQDAAVRFAVSILFSDKRFTELSYLLTEGHEIAGVEGDPGWLIERRDLDRSGEHSKYAEWPKNMQFHVNVDPNLYELAYPDMYLEKKEFYRYVGQALSVYAAHYPADPNIELIQSQLKI